MRAREGKANNGPSVWEYRINAADELHSAKVVVEHTYATLRSPVPPFEQCVGTHRLWGTDLGLAFSIDANCLEAAEGLQFATGVGRMCLVLLDHLVDEDIDDFGRLQIKRAVDRLMRLIVARLEGLKFDANELLVLIERFPTLLESFKVPEPDVASDAPGVRSQKWSGVFFPYSLGQRYLPSELHQNRMNFLVGFFEVCQLFDDFQDLQCDLKCGKWDNTLFRNKTVAECTFIARNRHRLAQPILFAAQNFFGTDPAKAACNNPVLANYVDFAHRWLEAKLEYLHGEGSHSIIPHWTVEAVYSSVGETILQSPRGLDEARLLEVACTIRPENLQSDLIDEKHLW